MNKSSGTAKKLLDIIHFLNPILPNLCKAVGVKRKKCPLLACFFFCVLKLSYSGVKEKLIRERERGRHRSSALFAYKKTSKNKAAQT